MADASTSCKAVQSTDDCAGVDDNELTFEDVDNVFWNEDFILNMNDDFFQYGVLIMSSSITWSKS